MSEYVSASTDMETSYAAESISSEAGVDYCASASTAGAALVVGVGAAVAWLVQAAHEGMRELDAAPAPTVTSLLARSARTRGLEDLRYDSALRELDAAPASTSTSLLDQSARTRGLEDLRYASALRNALERPELRLLRASIEAEATSDLRGGIAILDCLAEASPSLDLATGAREARSRLEQAVSKGAARQLAAEERILERAASDALRELGYQVKSRRNPRTGRVALRAEHPRQGTRVVVDLDPRHQHLAADFAGFSGVACAEERDRLFAALARGGYKTRVEGRFGHALRDGGPLSQEIDRLFAISGQVANDRHRAPSHEPTRVGG